MSDINEEMYEEGETEEEQVYDPDEQPVQDEESEEFSDENESMPEDEDSPAADEDAAEDFQSDGTLPSDRVADLVEFLVVSLVENEDAVSLDVTDSDEGTLIEISCDADDAGRVIGRKGRTIKAIRTLARALGSRVGTSVEVEVLG